MREQMHLHCNYVLWLADSESSHVCLEIVRGPHLNGEEVMVILLELLMKTVLSKK